MIEDRKTARVHIQQLLERVVRPAVNPRREPLTVTAHHLHGEPVGPEVVRERTFEPFAVGQQWGGRWDTTWFRFAGTVPADWAGRTVVARIDLGGNRAVGFSAEGLLWDGDRAVQGLHKFHQEYPLGAVAGGEAVDLLVEAAANPTPPFHAADWPLLQADLDGPAIYTLKAAELAVVDTEVEALWFDLVTLTQLLDGVPDEPRHSRVYNALVAATTAIDRHDVSGTAKEARELLAPVLAERATSGHRMTSVGHAHIDSAWLWPIRETKRKCARTFANQLRLLEQYPEHRFVCSQAAQYEWMKEGYPDLFAQIKAAVAEGRWEPVGGMWVEPDTNIPSGESLVRQVLFGTRFFRDELGVESDELWIPDVFGYSAALPQIAVGSGMRALITQKLSWNSINVFPHNTFVWQGTDGSRILTHFPPANTYNGEWSVEELRGAVGRFADHGRADRSLYLFGWGDGGGGPTRHMLELARRMGDLDGLPRVEMGTVDAFLDDLEHDADALDTWVGELYFELHRGTYTSHAAIKAGNRRGEEALREAELWWSALCVVAGWDDYPTEDLRAAWKLLLLNQFHDIIPGSSINWVNEEARRDYASIRDTAERLIAEAQTRLAGSGDAPVVFNPGSRDRREVVALPGQGLAYVGALGTGYTSAVTLDAPPPVTVAEGVLENSELRVTWNEDGLLTSVWDKVFDREVLAGPANLFQVHEDHPVNYDAWDVDLTYLDKVTDIVEAASIELVDEGPLRAGVRIRRRFGASAIDQVIRLDANSRRLEFHTDVDWQENHRFLKVAFPVAIHATRATYEIQHGHIERPTVWNTSWDVARFEVSAHRWADLSETDYGVALLNDSKYGYDIKGNVMRLSLLRAPGWPDPVADRGTHRFAYALYPHDGDCRVGIVAAEAESFNLPLDVRPGRDILGTSLVTVDRPGVSIEAVKKAEDEDALVIRVCEIAGSREPIRLTIGIPFTTAVRTDLLERELGPVDNDGSTITLTVRPFELVTLLVRGAGDLLR